MQDQTQLYQRVESAFTLLVVVLLFGHFHGSWLLFAILFFVPDLSMLGYTLGPKRGATIYNLFHFYAFPLALGALGLVLGNGSLQLVALIWTAHIGFDRMLGYGLKLPTGFGDTHLGASKAPKRA